MALNKAIDATMTLPGISRPVGRPRDPNAKTARERMREWRKRQAVGAALRRLETESGAFQPLLTSSPLAKFS